MRVLGIDLGGTKTALTLADEHGRERAGCQLPTHAERGAPDVLDRTLDAAAELLHGEPAPCAIGVSVPGVVAPAGIRLAPNIPGLDTFDLVGTLALRWPDRRVVLETDAKAAALAEYRWGHLAGCDTGIFLNLGTGLSAGIIVRGRVLRGAHGAAGEIGYQLLNAGGDHSEAGFAEGRAPLEEHFSGRALAERASALLARPVSTAEVLAAEPTDSRLAKLADEALATLSTAVANLAITLDPERIALGSGLTSAAQVIVPRILERVNTAVPFPPWIGLAKFPATAPLRGAVALALDTLSPAITTN